jgi:mannose-6-phosphate isomerase-like protein (cupin superfamily)
VHIFTLEEATRATRASDARYHEFLRVPALSAAMYILPGGEADTQTPHSEDEVYLVTSGTGRVQVGDELADVGPGSLIYVAKDVEHRFLDYADDLEILVLFAPAYTGRRAAPTT